MRNLKITILLSLIPVLLLAQSKDEMAIQNVIKSETINYHINKDREAYISYWQVKPESFYANSGTDGNNFFLTSEDFNAAIANNKFPPDDSATAYFSNIVIKAGGNVG